MRSPYWEITSARHRRSSRAAVPGFSWWMPVARARAREASNCSPGLLLAGPGQGFQLPVLLPIALSDVPADRARVGSAVMVTAQQSSPAGGRRPARSS
ncbi:MFS transporter [Streptomyces rectiverticillatus]|uniref:hypothetical protein n=1 Tax=Streptomyces rectiverticillatus TaxID=173860 RepID=UPI0015C31A70|nr:MFS transporter [Streptomyces rectiverticillatus]